MKAFRFILASAFSVVAAFAAAQSVTVEGKNVAFDAPPKMVNGTLMVPVRQLFEAMGVDMRWRSDRSVIEGLRKGSKVEIWIGSPEARVNDASKNMDQPPFISMGRTYVPLKFMAESFGYMVSMEKGKVTLQDVKR